MCMSTTTIGSKPEATRRLELVTSPHLHTHWSTRKVMWFVALALIPCTLSALVFFGLSQLSVIVVSVLVANAAEAAFQALRKRKVTLDDGSATVTGLLLALTLPPSFSLQATAVGAAVAIVIGKQLFGGLGNNIFNPALVGRAFLQAAYPVAMTTWVRPSFAVDGVTSATPLAAAKFEGITAGLAPLLIGNTGGTLGETSALAVLAGGAFLIAVGIVNWRIPLAVIAGVLLFSGLFWLINPIAYPSPLFHLLAGGLLFGAFFMATDWTTSPVTTSGMWPFGLGIALLVVIIRLFGGLPEGVMYSILLMNAFVPLLNRFTQPKPFGAVV